MNQNESTTTAVTNPANPNELQLKREAAYADILLSQISQQYPGFMTKAELKKRLAGWNFEVMPVQELYKIDCVWMCDKL